MRITQVRAQDGHVVPFDIRRVADAIYRASRSAGGDDRFLAEELAGVVALYLEKSHAGRIPAVADVESAVERVLVDTGHPGAAKAFVLHRDRRRAARGRVIVEDDGHGEQPLPLVGGESGGPVRAWTKERIVAALVDEAGLDAATAQDVARAVEERVLSRGIPRIGSSLVRALVDVELFDRGHGRVRERQRVVGMPKSDVARLLAEGADDRRAVDASALAESVGEEVLRQHVLEEAIPAEAAEAHRLGDLHLYDLGTPLCARHVALSMAALLERHLRGESTSRAGGARRFASAVGDAILTHGAAASRTFTLEDFNVYWAPFVDRLDEDALAVEARELLLSPGVLSFPRRGGLARLEIVLACEVPHRLAGREIPPPAPPGRSLGEFDDAALRAARALLAAVAELVREGAGARVPELTLVVPRDERRDPATRALLRDALALAAETGDPVFVLEDRDASARGGRRLRVAASDLPDPLRIERGDVSLVSSAAVNLVAAALRAGPGRIDVFIDEVERLAGLAVEAAAARRTLLTEGGDRPGGSLWPLRRGVEPLLDPDGGFHVVEAVGAGRAARFLVGDDDRAVASLLLRVRDALRARVGDAAARRDLVAVVADGSDAEACRRFAEHDAERFETVRAGFGGDERTYATADEVEPGTFVEPAATVGGRSSGLHRVRVRIDAEHRPPVDALVAGLEASCRDRRVIEHVLDPWPRRWVRPA